MNGRENTFENGIENRRVRSENAKRNLSRQLTIAKEMEVKKPENIQWALDQAAIVAITNPQGIITYVNDKFLEISKYEKHELLGNTHRILNSGYHSREFFKQMWRTIGTGHVWTGEINNRAKDGSIYWVSTTIVPFLDERGKPYKYIAIRTDITARMQMERELQHALENDFQTTIKQLSNLIFKIIRNEAGQFIFVLSEGKLGEKVNFNTERVKNKDIFALFPHEKAVVLERSLEKAYEGKHVDFELELQNIYFHIHLAPIFKDGQVTEVLGTTFDITDRKKDEEQIKYMAYHDSLTGLPNRTFILKAIEDEIEARRPFSLLFVDLDRFKSINDTLGHSVGDELLKAFSERLQTFDLSISVVSRFGGDEFLILVPEENKEKVAQLARNLIGKLTGFYMVSDIETYVSPSLGISMYPTDGNDADELIKNADAAMYRAKAASQSRGENTFRFYDASFTEDLQRKVLLETELRKALKDDQFELYYQPQVNIKTKEVVGVEALLRWNHPKLGIVSPLDFIPLAEETGLIIPIGEWVLKTASEQAKQWQNAGYPHMTMAVNVSIRQFMSHNFAGIVEKTLDEVDLDAKYLELEITESMTIDVKQTERILNTLQEIGVKISIDDFGSGYSSLNYLSNLPINKLKIDRVFLLNFDENNKAVVKAVIGLARNLNLEVLAEGVETVDHVQFLKNQSCHLVQGYHYFRPLPAKELKQFLEKGLQ